MVVGVAHQTDMLLHRGRDAKHPERPERVTTILEKIAASKRLERCRELRAAREATDAELLAVHTAGHIARVADASRAVQEQPTYRSLREPHGDGAIYYHEATDRSARCAVGSVLEAVDASLRGEVGSSFAIVRPPGHHAEADEALGFCFYNAVAVAAAAAQRTHGAKRVAILDWDVHHGNGTQHIFDGDGDVLFLSLHRYGRGFFPGTGAVSEVGSGKGLGRTVNVPWMQAGLGDADYLAAFGLIIMPILTEFRPELLLVSAGFDAALGDVQGKMKMSPNGFALLTKEVLALPKCKKVIVFEGGYHLTVSAECADAVLAELIAHDDKEAAKEVVPQCTALSAAPAESKPAPQKPISFIESSFTTKVEYEKWLRGLEAVEASAGSSSSGDNKGDDDVCSAPDVVRAASAGAVAAAISGSGAGELGTWTEHTLRQVIAAQREYWACLRTNEHAMAVDAYFTSKPKGRKRGRSDKCRES